MNAHNLTLPAIKARKFLEENSNEQITIGDIVEKIEKYLNNMEGEAHGRSRMKTKFVECW